MDEARPRRASIGVILEPDPVTGTLRRRRAPPIIAP